MSDIGKKQDRLGGAGRDPEKTIAAGTRTLVIGPYLTKRAAAQREARPGQDSPINLREPQARLEEAVGLAAAIDLDVVTASIVGIAAPRPATFLGKGKVEEILPAPQQQAKKTPKKEKQPKKKTTTTKKAAPKKAAATKKVRGAQLDGGPVPDCFPKPPLLPLAHPSP